MLSLLLAAALATERPLSRRDPPEPTDAAPVELPLESNGRLTATLPQPAISVQGHGSAGTFRTDVGGVVDVEGSRFSYTPPVDYAGLDSFIWRSSAEVIPVVLRVGHPPTAEADEYRTLADAVLEVSASDGLLAGDVSHHGAVVEVSGEFALDARTTAGGRVIATPEGAFRYRPPPGFVGTDRFTYVVANGLGEDRAEAKITVSGIELAEARPVGIPGNNPRMLGDVQ